jgi:hypothetical protein
MMAIRDYTFECCWLLVLLVISIVPASAQTESQRDFLDEASNCPPCFAYCFCPDAGIRP